jgi:predicted amidohydrolase
MQVDSNLNENPGNRLRRVLDSIESIESNIDLLVLPEHWLCGAFNHYSSIRLPVRLYEDFVAEAKDIAVRKNFHILGGSGLVVDSLGKSRNAAFLISPTGDSLLSYFKIHPFSHELGNISGGDGIQTFRIGDVRISTLICYDLRFPEIFRQPENYGSEIYIVVAAWPRPRVETWNHLLRSRAIENQAFIVGVNGTGIQDSAELGGNSMVIGPSGEILASLGNREGSIEIELNLELVHTHRNSFTYLDDARLLTRLGSQTRNSEF